HQDLEGVLGVVIEAVEKHAPQPAAHEDADDGPGCEVVEDSGLNVELGEPRCVPPGNGQAQEDSRQVRESIPAHREGPQLEQDRIDLWKGHPAPNSDLVTNGMLSAGSRCPQFAAKDAVSQTQVARTIFTPRAARR